MSNQISKSAKERQAALIEMVRLVRLQQIASDKMDDAFCRMTGINLTDGRCLDLLDVHDGLTAGELAEAANLSPGAVTTVLDRLERMGLVTRARDDADRRRVLVELTPKARELAFEAYGPVAAYAQEYIEQLTDEEIEIISRFLEVAVEVNERRARELHADEG
jgi:DNA-binding MarR family transcriptional regulator